MLERNRERFPTRIDPSTGHLIAINENFDITAAYNNPTFLEERSRAFGGDIGSLDNQELEILYHERAAIYFNTSNPFKPGKNTKDFGTGLSPSTAELIADINKEAMPKIVPQVDPIIVNMESSNIQSLEHEQEQQYIQNTNNQEANFYLSYIIRNLIKSLLSNNANFLGINEGQEGFFIHNNSSLFGELNNDITDFLIVIDEGDSNNLTEQQKALVKEIIEEAKARTRELIEEREKWLKNKPITGLSDSGGDSTVNIQEKKEVKYFKGRSFSIGWEVETNKIKILRKEGGVGALNIVFSFKENENLEFSLIEDTQDQSYKNHTSDTIKKMGEKFNSIRNLEIKTNGGIDNINDVKIISEKMEKLINYINNLGPDVTEESINENFIENIKQWAIDENLIIKTSENSGGEISVRSLHSPAYRPQITCKVPISKIPHLFHMIYKDTSNDFLGNFINTIKGTIKLEKNIEDLNNTLHSIEEKINKINKDDEENLKKQKNRYWNTCSLRANLILSNELKGIIIKDQSANGLFYLFIFYIIALFNGCKYAAAPEQGMKSYLGVMSRYSFFQMFSNLGEESQKEFKDVVEKLIKELDKKYKDLSKYFRMVSYYDYEWGLVEPSNFTMKSFYESFVIFNTFNKIQPVNYNNIIRNNNGVIPFYVNNFPPQRKDVGYGIDKDKKEWDVKRSNKGQIRDIVSPPPFMGLDYSMGSYELEKDNKYALIEFRLYAEIRKSKDNLNIKELINTLAGELFSEKELFSEENEEDNA